MIHPSSFLWCFAVWEHIEEAELECFIKMFLLYHDVPDCSVPFMADTMDCLVELS